MSRRCVIAREGVPTKDGRLVVRGSLTWDETVPLLVMREAAPKELGHHGSIMLGWVTEIRRGKNGVITGEVSHPVLGMACEMDLNGSETSNEEDVTVFVRARITSVTLGRNPVWEGMWIK